MSVEGIFFLGQALNQRMNTVKLIPGKSTEREVGERGLWCVVVVMVHACLVPGFHTSADY